MPYTHDIQHTKLRDAEVAEPSASLTPAIAELIGYQEAGSLPMLSLPERQDDLGEIEEVAGWFRSRFAHVLVVGTGGSSLGGQTLAALKENPYQTPCAGAPSVHFLDNVDPHSMDMLLATLDLQQTGCLVVSKSGRTAEIMAQFLVLLSALEKQLGKDAIKDHFMSDTIPDAIPLRELSARYGMRVLAHDPKVGGRFSVLSLVGLIPAAIAGVNVRHIRKGAAEVWQALVSAKDTPQEAAPAVGAAAHYALMEQGCDVAVLMPYCDRLGYFGMWFRQLWAESLGKDGKGSTPVRALGTVDQHSQLQLYLDGPKNKFITLITQSCAGKGREIEGLSAHDEKLGYLQGKALGEVMEAYQHGTTQSLIKNGCRVRLMHVQKVDEVMMGALLMHFVLETVLTAKLMGINAYDQPAVEDSKTFAREYLQKQKEIA